MRYVHTGGGKKHFVLDFYFWFSGLPSVPILKDFVHRLIRKRYFNMISRFLTHLYLFLDVFGASPFSISCFVYYSLNLNFVIFIIFWNNDLVHSLCIFIAKKIIIT